MGTISLDPPEEDPMSTTATVTPTLTLTPIARKKLQEYLAQEPSETTVRLLVEDDGRFGLSLDVAAADDVRFALDGIPFVVETPAAAAIDGLKVDYLEQGASSGFALTGGKAAPRAVVLRTETTPNPNAMKFVLAFGRGATSSTWTSKDQAGISGPVAELFSLPGVESVFELADFVTITRTPGADWEAIVPRAREILGRMTMPGRSEAAELPADATFEQKLAHFIRMDVAPFLQQDGGDIELVGFVNGIVKVRLTGACGTCPSSIATLQGGVERRLKEKFPGEVRGMERVADPAGAAGHHGHHHH
jgi:Fe-S cluster biogenesis protein NfuA/Fe-S cluster assembly iron-binding protein IscA